MSMVVLLIMTTGMSNLAGSIASDRDPDLYSKLSSMPIKPWSDSLGRIITVVVFSSMGSAVLAIIGIVIGAEVVVGGLFVRIKGSVESVKLAGRILTGPFLFLLFLVIK